MQKPQTNMARFLLKYDYSKAKSGGMTRFQKHEAEGVRFSEGYVAVVYKNGNTDGFPNVNAMTVALERQGSYELEWVD